MTSILQPSLFPGEEIDALQFASLGSGSSGNCYLLKWHDTAILIDAGVAPRSIVQRLRGLGVHPESLAAIFVTHDHADHVRSVGLLASRYNIPIYASSIVARELCQSRYIAEDLSGYMHSMEVGTCITLGEMTLRSFEVPHDAAQNVGYSLTMPLGTFTLITDIGHTTPEIAEAVAQSNWLVFESNYDVEMLSNGSYPDFLKQRIVGGNGHISNTLAADFIATHYHLDLRFLALCHLSKHNNHPELAMKTMEQRLFNEGIRVGKDLSLHVLGRNTSTPFFHLK